MGRREALEVLTRRELSQRKACRYLGLSRRVATYTLKQPEKDRSLGERLIAAAQEVPRFGYRRMSAWLALGESRVRRMWRALQLNIPRRRPRRRRGGNDIRLPGATQPNSVWSYDFVHDQLVDGRTLKMLCVIDGTTAPNLPPPRSRAGCEMLQSARPSSRLAVRGKTGSSKASTANCATNC